MVFSTPCSKSGRADGRWPARLLAFLLLAWALWGGQLGLALADPRSATVTQLKLEQVDEAVYLTAQLQFELPQVVEEALEKGVAIYFVAEAELYRERWYWTDRKVAQAARYMRLAYQPLTRRWRLNVSPVAITNAGVGVLLNQNFDTLSDALEVIKRVGRLRLGDSAEIGAESSHPVSFRFRLDTSQLPRPLQIGTVGQNDWNISVEKSTRLTLENLK